MLQLINKSKKTIITENLIVADGFWSRMRGLMWKRDMPEDEGLLLVPCNSVHSMFMRFPIDVLFLDKEFNIVKILDYLKPWRCSPYVRGAFQAVELKAGEAKKKDIEIGDNLSLLRVN